MFTHQEFSPESLVMELAPHCIVIPKHTFRNTLLSVIDDVKVDFVRHNYPLLRPLVEVEGLTLASMEDVAAMKVQVIWHSGKRLKDFIDMYYLLEHFSVDEMLDLFSMKYENLDRMLWMRALGYFKDIDPTIDPPKMRKPLSLEQIKERILDALLHSRRKY